MSRGLRHCLVYLPHSYTGRGPAESCARLLAAFPAQGWDVTVHLLRARTPLPDGIAAAEAAGGLLRHAPFGLIERHARASLDRDFSGAIDRAPEGSVAWFWPNAPVELVRRARERGIVTVREMINSPQSLISFPLRNQAMLCVTGLAVVLLARSPTLTRREDPR